MSVYVKQISELPIVEEINGSENIIVNDNGETKQLPIDKVSPQNIKKEQLSDELLNYLATKENAWPSELPMPSDGGYGWTEQGGQTVITWDGDTEGRVNFEFAGGTFYLVSNTFATIDELDGSTITIGGRTYQMQRDDIPPIVDNLVYALSEGGCSAKAGTYDGFVVPTDGVYFEKSEGHDIITSLTYGTPDTVHKIDEKYLPASGGAMAVVNGIINIETMEIELADNAIEVLDKINADFNSGTIYPVVANLTMLAGNKEVITGCNMSSYAIVDGEVGLSFQSSEINRGSFDSKVVKIGKLNGEWVTQIMSASIPVNLS